ncbi:MAG: glycosyltransferase [Reichenbachiella sp.]|uniref:glycosyltransferase n=1 Tax=Reichenbachiella sp. TaxID=2184521 RepID=UPI0032993B24
MIFSIVIGIVFIWMIFLGSLLFIKTKKKDQLSDKQPFVSILIALRNEESQVQELCESLNDLSYPSSKYEILFGDDDSQDHTLKLLEKYQPENAKVISFDEKESGAFGKQKILAELSKLARGDYFLFTDADMLFQPNWIEGSLSGVSDRNELIVGLTTVSNSNWQSSIQNLDWLFNQYIISCFSKLGIFPTAWGNNMLISRKNYEAVGGHQSLEPTVVEDVALLRALVANGGELVVNENAAAVATTKPITTMMGLLHQRKRWMQGLVGLNPSVILTGIVKLLFWPALIVLSFYGLPWLVLGLITIIIKMVILKRMSKITKSRFSLIHLLLFEIYDFVFYFFTFVFYVLPIDLKWKGRRY